MKLKINKIVWVFINIKHPEIILDINPVVYLALNKHQSIVRFCIKIFGKYSNYDYEYSWGKLYNQGYRIKKANLIIKNIL